MSIHILYGYSRFDIGVPSGLSLESLISHRLSCSAIITDKSGRFEFYKITSGDVFDRIYPNTHISQGETITIIDNKRRFYQLYVIYPNRHAYLTRFYDSNVDVLIQDAFSKGAIWIEKYSTYTPLIQNTLIPETYEWRYVPKKHIITNAWKLKMHRTL